MELNEVKTILDGWGRDLLVYCVNNHPVHRNNDSLKEFINEELSYEEVLFYLDNYNQSENLVLEYRSTAQSFQKMEKIEGAIMPFLTFPLYSFFSNTM